MNISILTEGVEFDPLPRQILKVANLSSITLSPTADGAVNVEVQGQIECRNGAIQVLGTFRVEGKP
jgi:hypothetical protein